VVLDFLCNRFFPPPTFFFYFVFSCSSAGRTGLLSLHPFKYVVQPSRSVFPLSSFFLPPPSVLHRRKFTVDLQHSPFTVSFFWHFPCAELPPLLCPPYCFTLAFPFLHNRVLRFNRGSVRPVTLSPFPHPPAPILSSPFLGIPTVFRGNVSFLCTSAFPERLTLRLKLGQTFLFLRGSVLFFQSLKLHFRSPIFFSAFSSSPPGPGGGISVNNHFIFLVTL